jgi:hypothetical protein
VCCRLTKWNGKAWARRGERTEVGKMEKNLGGKVECAS